MSAANPSYDLDALHRAQRAYEPSMEEILASIRNIISEERTGTAQPPATPTPQAAAPEPAPSAPPVAEQPAAPERAEPPAIPRVVWPPPEAEAAQEPVAAPTAVKPLEAAAPTAVKPPESAASAREESLVSPEAHAAIANSFEALSVGVAVQNSTMIEDAVRDMIRPMLKAWLDDNLPSMVEGLVRAEIQRVARGGR
jgi:cell pole-organizing protein PopZ